MTKIVINPSDLQDKKTSLYRKDGNIIYQLLPYTTADQVELADKRNVQTAITKLITDVGTAQSTANTAKSTADTALSTANTAKTIANTVKAEVENETTGLAATKTLANTANTNANTAISNAATALSTANTAKSTADSLSSSVNNDTTGLSATREIANTAKNAIDTHKAKKDNPHEVTKAQVGLGNIPNAISSAIDSNSESQLATSKAVKIAYDKADEAASSVSSTTETANTALSTANSALSAVNGKLDKAGGIMTGILNFDISDVNSIEAPASNNHKTWINFMGSNASLAVIQYAASPANVRQLILNIPDNYAHAGDRYWAGLRLGWDENSKAFASCPGMRDNNYSSDIVTARNLKDYAPQVIPNDSIMYAGGANASDTADLHAGRGFSPDKPFASMDGILKYIASYCAGKSVITVKLQANMAGPSFGLRIPNLSKLTITSDATKRTMTLGTYGIAVSCGCVELNNLNISGSNLDHFFNSLGSWGSAPFIVLGSNLNLNGSVTNATALASLGGIIVAYYAISGSVTGKHYSAFQGGRIYTNNRGINAIPGTEAGYCDSVSTYA